MSEIMDATKELDKLLEIYESTVEDYQKSVEEALGEFGITQKFARIVANMSDTQIDALDLISIKDLLKKGDCNENAFKEEYYKLGDTSTPFFDFCVKRIHSIKESVISYDETKDSLEELKQNRGELFDAYVKKLKSPEYKAAKAKYIHEDLLQRISETTDPLENARLQKQYDTLRETEDLTFLTKRLINHPKSEVKSVKESYFTKEKGSYVMNKYYNALNKLGCKYAVHYMFYNLEETLLPEDYLPYNNLFLFYVVRFIGFCDLSSDREVGYITAIISALNDVVMGEATEDTKNAVLKQMRIFYSYFDNPVNHEYFKEHNTNYKYHPERIKAEEEMNAKKKEAARENIKRELGSYYDDSYKALAEGDDPEKVLQQIIDEELLMLKELDEAGWNTKHAHSYEEVFMLYERMQNGEEPNVDKEEEEIDDDLVESLEEVDESDVEIEFEDEEDLEEDSDEEEQISETTASVTISGDSIRGKVQEMLSNEDDEIAGEVDE